MSKDPKSGIILRGLTLVSPGWRGSLEEYRKAGDTSERLINYVES